MMQTFTSLVQEMLAFGFTKEQIEELLVAHQDEITTKIFSDAIDNSSDEKLEELKKEMENATTVEQKTQALEKAAVLAYGENAKTQKETILAEILESVFSIAKQMKNIYKQYEQGEPEAVALVQKAMQSPDYELVESVAKGE